MKNYSKKRDSSNRRRNDGDRQMHSAVCASCGRNCEVPFRPTGDKPIYCSNCFEKERGSSSNRRDSRGDSRRDNRGDRDNRRDFNESKRMFSATCTSCGVRCEVPFRPTGDKPIYCSKCFEAVGSTRSTGFKNAIKPDDGLSKSDIAIIKDQLIGINKKLEKILLVIKPEEDKKLKEKKQPDKKEVKKIVAEIQNKVTPVKETKKTTKPVKEKKVVKKFLMKKKAK